MDLENSQIAENNRMSGIRNLQTNHRKYLLPLYVTLIRSNFYLRPPWTVESLHIISTFDSSLSPSPPQFFIGLLFSSSVSFTGFLPISILLVRRAFTFLLFSFNVTLHVSDATVWRLVRGRWWLLTQLDLSVCAFLFPLFVWRDRLKIQNGGLDGSRKMEASNGRENNLER